MKPWKAQDTSNNYSGMIMVALQTSHAGRKVETIRLIKEIKGLHTALDRANCTSKIHQLGVVESKRQRGTIRHTYNILNSISSNTPFDTPTLEPSSYTPYDIPCWIIQYSVKKKHVLQSDIPNSIPRIVWYPIWHSESYAIQYSKSWRVYKTNWHHDQRHPYPQRYVSYMRIWNWADGEPNFITRRHGRNSCAVCE